MNEKDNPTRQPASAAINRISDDNQSGAAEILSRAAEVFSLLARQQTLMNRVDPESARRSVIETCARLALAQPDMAGLANLASEVSAAASASKATDGCNVFELALETARSFIRRAERSARLASSHASALISDGARVLTHSRSSTVLAAFSEARRAGRNFSVIATESRPALEGRKLAEALAGEGASVTLIADAAAASVIERVDFVLLGADRVTPEFLVNKIGTRMIALAARERGVPVYALCDTSKFTSAAKIKDSAGDSPQADELWADAPAGILVLNRYFEPVPLIYFTAIITENGLLTPDQAKAKSVRKSLFGPLQQSE